MMVEGIAEENSLTGIDPDAEAPEHRPRVTRRRVKVRRKQEKFPQPLRIAILIAAPIALWTAIFFLARALL